MPQTLAAIPLVGVGSSSFAAGTTGILGSGLSAAGVGTVASLAGTGLQAYGQQQQIKQQESMAKYNQEVMEQNARAATAEGVERMNRQRKANQRFLSQQQGQMVKSGIDTGSGSSLAVMADTAAMLELEALDAGYTAQKEAAGYRQRGAQYGMEASSLKKSRPFALGSTVLGGVTGAARFAL